MTQIFIFGKTNSCCALGKGSARLRSEKSALIALLECTAFPVLLVPINKPLTHSHRTHYINTYFSTLPPKSTCKLGGGEAND